MSRPIHYIFDALNGLVYISNLWSPFNEMVETRNLRPQKKVLSHELLSKKCYAFFLSFLFLSFFLTFFLFYLFIYFFIHIENEQCEKRFFNRVLVPFSPRFAATFLQYFSWQLKTKQNKTKLKMGSARIYRQAANVSPHTYARGFVRQTFIYLFNFFFSQP